MGVLRQSRGPSESYRDFERVSLERTLLCKTAIESGLCELISLSSCVRHPVKERELLAGAKDSKPHAAITSVIPLPDSTVELAAAQQSSRIRTSHLAC